MTNQTNDKEDRNYYVQEKKKNGFQQKLQQSNKKSY